MEWEKCKFMIYEFNFSYFIIHLEFQEYIESLIISYFYKFELHYASKLNNLFYQIIFIIHLVIIYKFWTRKKYRLPLPGIIKFQIKTLLIQHFLYKKLQSSDCYKIS